jgi:hypothetical protein
VEVITIAGMITFTADDEASSALGRRFEWLTANVMAAELVRQPVLDELKRQAPVAEKVIKGVEPGAMRDGIQDEVVSGAGMVALRYSSDADYVGYIIDGTGPHEILPRNASVLHWIDTQTGESVFRHRVWHPGTQPNDFPDRAAARVMPLVETAFASVFERF